MSNENVARSLRWFEEVWNQRRTDTIDELLMEESVAESEGGLLRGPEEFKTRMHTPFLSAFPDLHVTVENTVAQGEDVVVCWRASGTHGGDGLGLHATGRPMSIRGMTWHRYRDGKLVQGWDCWNQEGLMNQLRSGGE